MAAHPAMRYQNKVVIFTGGSKGIGEGCVRSFAEAGAKIVFCARGVEDGQALRRELAKRPGEVTFISCDVTNLTALKGVIDSTVEMHGRLGCLINNAGWHPPHQPIADFD